MKTPPKSDARSTEERSPADTARTLQLEKGLGFLVRLLDTRATVLYEQLTEQNDIDKLYRLISNHAELTGSPQGKWIVENWESTIPKFVKVFPHEYKRVLGVERAASVYASPMLSSHLVTANATATGVQHG